MEAQEEFKKVDEKLDKVMADDRQKALQGKKPGFKKSGPSNVRMKQKQYMTISDVDVDDARWFKQFCDDNFDGKQFLGIKVIKNVMERMDPFTKHVLNHVNELHARVDHLEGLLSDLLKQPEEEKKGPVIPQTMGAARRR